MALTAGTRLGPYEIQAALGAGGMGEVYRARDTRLDRNVAIKVLSAHLSENAELRERFDREARTISNLSHPHICTLHDIGHQDGVDFLVMELLEGETLEKRIQRGPLPVSQVVKIAKELAEALDKAHRQGIVHRDLKPANVMLTKSGAKLMDFGLAKIRVEPAPAVAALTDLTVASKKLTTEGMIVGTFQYMAPEQLEGQEADSRSDIFALGAVIYEMATGRPAFAGRTRASLIAAILSSEPKPMTEWQPLMPPALDRVVRTCLAKDPDERWQTAHDVKLQLQWIAEGGSQAGVAAPVAARRKSRERLAWALVAVLAAGSGLLAYLARRPQPGRRLVRSYILPPEKQTFNVNSPGGGHMAVSPDGQRIAFVAIGSDGSRKLWVRQLDTLAAQPLAGTDEASYPFWSPDNRSIGFFSEGRMRRVEATGGPVQALCEATEGRGGAWNTDGVIIFAPNAAGALYKVAASGGNATALTKIDVARGESTHRWPSFLPDGRHFLYVVRSSEHTRNGIVIESLDGGPRRFLMETASNGIITGDRMLFVRDRALMAQRFDAKKLAVLGDAFPVADDIAIDVGLSKAFFSASATGVLVYMPMSASGDSRMVWYDRTGKEVRALSDVRSYASPSFSPGGRTVAFTDQDSNGNIDVWTYETVRNVRSRFTFAMTPELIPIWSPDGKYIAYSVTKKGNFDVYKKAADGSGEEQLLFESPADDRITAWSKNYLVLRQVTPGQGMGVDVAVVSLADGKATPFAQTSFDESWAQISPDEHWMAYTSNESGKDEVYVAAFPGPGGKRQVSTGGGSRPTWRKDGKELFYLAADLRLMAMQVSESAGSFNAGTPTALFQTHAKALSKVYDVRADGQQFVMSVVAEQTGSPLTLVVNWDQEQKP